jgi:hypothetical protein
MFPGLQLGASFLTFVFAPPDLLALSSSTGTVRHSSALFLLALCSGAPFPFLLDFFPPIPLFDGY